MHNKQQLRVSAKELLEKRSKDWFEDSTRVLTDKLKKWILDQDFDGPAALLGWIPHFKGEVDLISSIGSSLPENFSLFCPRCSASGELTFYQMPSELIQGSFGIPEPKEDPAREIDFTKYKTLICLVPGLAFDRSGGRLGRGKGIYDKFLSMESVTPLIKIGVCWSFQLIEFIPCEDHDQRMDFVLNEQEVIKV